MIRTDNMTIRIYVRASTKDQDAESATPSFVAIHHILKSIRFSVEGVSDLLNHEYTAVIFS